MKILCILLAVALVAATLIGFCWIVFAPSEDIADGPQPPMAVPPEQSPVAQAGGIEILDWSVAERGNDRCRIVGAVKNTGASFAYSVRVRVVSSTDYGEQLDDSTVSSDPDGLQAGQAGTFSIILNDPDRLGSKFAVTALSSTREEVLLAQRQNRPATPAPPSPSKPRLQPKVTIVDWTNTNSFGYCIVKGFVRNDGAATAYWVETVVKGLDAEGNLVDLANGFTNPIHVPIGREATFESMLKGEERIKDLKLSVTWKAEE